MMQNSGYPFITPSSTCLSEDLLFFDTFSHSGPEKDNFDLVQFPSPVVIDLIKIVPLGQPVEAKIPGNVRLGATNPSKCELEFFINDLSKQDAHTMTDLGKFYCSEKDTDFSPPVQIQTDGLLLRGSYRTLTLALFGQIVAYDEKAEDEQQAIILSATSPPAQTPASPVASERDIPTYLVGQELLQRPEIEGEGEGIIVSNEEESESYDESTTLKSGEILKDGLLQHDDNNVDEMIEEPIADSNQQELNNKDLPIYDDLSSNCAGITPANYTPSEQTNKSYDTRSGRLDSNSYSRRSSSRKSRNEHKESSKRSSRRRSDPIEDGNNSVQNVTDEDVQDQETKEWCFNVDTYRPKPLIYFADPSLTLQERSLMLHGSKNSSDKTLERGFNLPASLDSKLSDDWVTLVEDMAIEISNLTLTHTINNEEMLKYLVRQVCLGLDFELAIGQKLTGFKVRHLRAGLKLATVMFHCGLKAVSALLEAAVPQKVLQLYHQDQMSLPARLLIFKCLSAICDTVAGVEHLISYKYDWPDIKPLLDEVRKSVLDQEQVTSKPTTTTSLEVSESITKFEPSTTKDDVVEEDESPSKQFISTTRKPSPTKLEEKLEIENKPLTCYQLMVLILFTQPTTRATIAIGNLIKKIRLYQKFSELSNLSLADCEESDDSQLASNEDRRVRPDANYLEQSASIIQDIVNLMKNGAIEIAQPNRYLPAKVQFQVKPALTETYLAVYKWLKHFCILEHLNSLLNIIQAESYDSMSSGGFELSIRLQNLCLLLLQQILDSPRGSQLFLTQDSYEMTGNLLKTLAEKKPAKRSAHMRMSDGIENCPSAAVCRDESLSILSSHDMSLKLAYGFKVFSCIDKLFHFHRDLLNKNSQSTLYDPEKVLHQLFIISGHPYGLAAMVKHFSCIGNLDCLLRFLDMPEYHKQLEFVKETSIDFTLELVGTFFRLNNNVLEIADEYLDTLLELCKTKDKTLSVRIKSLLPWLSPFDTDQLPLPLITYSDETFRQLMRVIRKSIPDYSIPFAKGLNFELPPQMITAVRILRQLCIPPQVETFIKTNFDVYSAQKLASNDSKSPQFMAFVDSLPHQQNHNHSWNLNLQISRNLVSTNSLVGDDSITDQLSQISNTFKLFQPYDESICGELKYHYGLMLVFEQEGLKRLLNTLRELTGNYPRPIYQSAALSGFRGRIVISYIHSVIILLHSIVCHLINARASEFQDTSIIPVILETYSLLCFVPKPKQPDIVNSGDHEPTSLLVNNENDLVVLQKSITLRYDNYQLAQQTKKLILSILMSYTQMCLSVSESEENVISKSMWTKMLKEVMDFTLSTPVFFHHGLDVLTKILPSPLPCSSMMDSIDQEQLFKNINHRKLWSAHLHPLHQQIEQMISHLSICHQSNIRQLLCYLCNQLCDLSSNTACMVAKIITDTLVTCAAKLTLDTNGTLTPPEQQQQQQQQQTNQQQQPQVDEKLNIHVLAGTKESAYAVKMILNLLSNLITNQTFETAFTNQLQMIGKRDEKLLANLQNTLKLNEDYRPGEPVDDNLLNASATNCLASVQQLIDSIKTMNNNATKDGCPVIEVAPPEELTKINLIEVARKTSDRFSLTTGLRKTYRLKVLLDMKSCAQRSSESSSKRFDHTPHNHQELSVPSSHKPYVAPIRGRGRSTARPDSFRSRPQNTSRPPSIHVDDFIDIFSDGPTGGQNSTSGQRGFPLGANGGGGGKSSSSSDPYRISSRSLYPPPMAMPPQPQVPLPGPPPPEMSQHEPSPLNHRGGHPSFFSPQPPSGSPYSSGGSGRSHAKSKYMKMK